MNPKYGLEGTLFLSKKDAESPWTFDEDEPSVTSGGEHKLSLFQVWFSLLGVPFKMFTARLGFESPMQMQIQFF